MISVLIADDEYLQRELVKNIVPWEALNLRLAAEAENGTEAVRLAQETGADILVMDINMPFLNGLDAARQIRQANPDTQTIILTAYGEFEYARQALHLEAVRYVLKPLDPKQLIEALEIAKSRLEGLARQRQTAELLRWEQERKRAEGFIRTALLHGHPNGQEAEAEWARLGWADGQAYCVLMIARQASVPDWETLQTLAVQSFPQGLCVVGNDALWCVLPLERPGAGLAQELQGLFLRLEKEPVYGGVSDIHNVLEDMPQACKEAQAVEKRQGFSLCQAAPSTHRRAEEAKAYIDAHYGDAMLGLGEVAEAIGSNPSYLSNIFKAEWGVSLSRYLVTVRMEKAAALLREHPEKAVLDVAEACGYHDGYYFSKSFKKHFGIRPSQYRASHQ